MAIGRRRSVCVEEEVVLAKFKGFLKETSGDHVNELLTAAVGRSSTPHCIFALLRKPPAGKITFIIYSSLLLPFFLKGVFRKRRSRRKHTDGLVLLKQNAAHVLVVETRDNWEEEDVQLILIVLPVISHLGC